eukprot:809745-Rhodomonas_salina.1
MLRRRRGKQKAILLLLGRYRGYLASRSTDSTLACVTEGQCCVTEGEHQLLRATEGDHSHSCTESPRVTTALSLRGPPRVTSLALTRSHQG